MLHGVMVTIIIDLSVAFIAARDLGDFRRQTDVSYDHKKR